MRCCLRAIRLLSVLPLALAVACSAKAPASVAGAATPAGSGEPSSGGDGNSQGDGGNAGGGGTGHGGGGSPDGSTSSCSTCARDWNKFPAVAEFDGPSELWVVSDVHGDYQALTKLLAGARVMSAAPASPQSAVWTAGTANLIVVGDLIDKGPDAPDVVRLLIALQTSAAAAGGRVVVTMGNHEAEFLADPSNSKASGADGIDGELQTDGLTPAATAAGDNDVGSFIRNLPIAARVGAWFFAHAGNTGGKTIAQLRADLQGGIDSAGFGAPILAAPDSILEARLSSSPNWCDATQNAQGLLSGWAGALGVHHLVMGHQPGAVTFADGTRRSADQMVQLYGGALFLIDTGMSVGADNSGGALLHVSQASSSTESWESVRPDGSTHSL